MSLRHRGSSGWSRSHKRLCLQNQYASLHQRPKPSVQAHSFFSDEGTTRTALTVFVQMSVRKDVLLFCCLLVQKYYLHLSLFASLLF